MKKFLIFLTKHGVTQYCEFIVSDNTRNAVLEYMNKHNMCFASTYESFRGDMFIYEVKKDNVEYFISVSSE